MKTEIIPFRPLDREGSVKILLGKTASDALKAAGDTLLIEGWVSRDVQHEGRFVIVAIPADKDALNDAYRVAVAGTHRAVKIKAARPNQTS